MDHHVSQMNRAICVVMQLSTPPVCLVARVAHLVEKYASPEILVAAKDLGNAMLQAPQAQILYALHIF